MPTGNLSPAQRSLRARMAAYTLHATHDARETTAKARAAGPGQLAYWESRVDPTGELAPAERARRATAAKKAHYLALAIRSAEARRKRAS